MSLLVLEAVLFSCFLFNYKYLFVEISTKNPENFQTTCRGLMGVYKVFWGGLFQILKKNGPDFKRGIEGDLKTKV
jgi:hypothetical protein